MVEGLVSIITPCYNGGKYIAETINSVISQTYVKWEMIIVDDGSKDDSFNVIEPYIQKDNRIKYIYQDNAGSASARNHGIKECDGQYIALLDADDIWLPEFLEKQIAFMKANNAICVACAYGRINDKSEDILRNIVPLKVIRMKDMEIMNRIGCLTGLYDCSKYGKIYLHEELRSIRDDYAYWLDIVKLEGLAYGNQEMLAKYRVLDNSTTGNKRKLIKKQYQFQRNYLKKNVVVALKNVFLWGVEGLRKYS